MNVLVTGATGFLGRHVAELLSAEHTVYSAARRADAVTAGQVVDVDLAGGDLRALPASIDAVIHLAQSENYRAFPERADDIFAVNTASTVALLDYARRAGAKKFILASTGGVYGFGEHPFTERDPVAAPRELGFYAASKYAAELFAQSYASVLDVIVLRFFFIYGTGQKTSMLMPRLVQSVRSGEEVTLAGDSGLRINPIFVTDAARAVERSLHVSGSHVVNVAGPQQIDLRSLVEAIGEATGHTPLFRVDDTPARSLIGDIERMSTLLAAPAVGCREGLTKLVNADATGGGASH